MLHPSIDQLRTTVYYEYTSIRISQTGYQLQLQFLITIIIYQK